MTDLAINGGQICRPSTDFIYVGNVSHDICDKLAEMWHKSDEINLWKVHGMSGSYVCPDEVNPEVKESLDVCIPPGYMHPTVEQYYKELWVLLVSILNSSPLLSSLVLVSRMICRSNGILKVVDSKYGIVKDPTHTYHKSPDIWCL